jgi:very-short-patch-repair endonuclease
MTLPEVVLWNALRHSRIEGLRFRRQHPVGPYVLDFYCPAARLAAEVDGQFHGRSMRAARDRTRDAWLTSRHVRVLRVAAKDVLDDDALSAVVTLILEAAAAPSTAFGGPPPP